MITGLPDLLDEGLKVIFIGYNPSLRSAELGHNFAGRSNRFWKILHLAGLTDRLLTYEEDHSLMSLGYGLTNIVGRPTKEAAEISKQEFLEGREILKEKLITYRPIMACYVGAGVYKAFSGRNKKKWGLQDTEEVNGVKDFVAPNTSGLVRLPLEQQIAIYKEIREALEQ